MLSSVKCAGLKVVSKFSLEKSHRNIMPAIKTPALQWLFMGGEMLPAILAAMGAAWSDPFVALRQFRTML
jgi:hypothetical protein